MTAALAELLLDTLRLGSQPEGLRSRWAAPALTSHADAMAAWIAWERGEQWLLRRLGDAGALDVAPAPLVEALRAASREQAKAGMAVDAETADVVRMLAAHGIPCILMKGPARRAAAALYPYADARRTADVDVLVRAGDAEPAWRLLAAAGYAPLYAPGPATVAHDESELWMRSRHHLRPLIRPGHAAVELHVSTSWELPAEAAWERNTAGASEIEWQGLTVRVPSATELLWHGLTHGLVWGGGPASPAAWVLRYGLDTAAIHAVAKVDWGLIAQRLGGPELPDGDRARMWLSAASQLSGLPLPASVAPQQPFPLLRLISWRLAAFASRMVTPRWRTKLLDEATRMELQLPPAELDPGQRWHVILRRRTASLAARGAYGGWRWSHRRDFAATP